MWNEQLQLKIVRRTRDFVPITALSLVVAGLYAIVYLIYLMQVHRQLHFTHGYPRLDLKPGPFVSDRYTLEWWIVVVVLVNLAPLLSFIWMFYGATNMLRRMTHLYVTGVVLFFDFLALLVLLVIAAFFCNGPLYPGSLCNDPSRYCLAFSTLHTSRCPPATGLPPPPALPSNQLVVNPAFTWLSIWLLVMSLFNVLTLILNSSLAQIARRYTNRTLGRGIYML